MTLLRAAQLDLLQFISVRMEPVLFLHQGLDVEDRKPLSCWLWSAEVQSRSCVLMLCKLHKYLKLKAKIGQSGS